MSHPAAEGICYAVIRTLSGLSERQEEEEKKSAAAGSMPKKTGIKSTKNPHIGHALIFVFFLFSGTLAERASQSGSPTRSGKKRKRTKDPIVSNVPVLLGSHARACWHAGTTCGVGPGIPGPSSRPLTLPVSRVAVSESSSALFHLQRRQDGAMRCLKGCSAAPWPLRMASISRRGAS